MSSKFLILLALALAVAGTAGADDGWSPEVDQKPASGSSGSSGPTIHDGSAPDPRGIGEHPMAVYVHPISLLVSTGAQNLPGYYALTLEREIGPSSSVVLQPNLIWGDLGDGEDPTRVRSWGAKFGYRSYFNSRKSEGFFGGPSVEYSSYILTATDLRLQAVVFGVLGYLGYRAKWESATLFVDAGLGFGFISVTGDSKLLSHSAMGGGTDFGGDFGLGVPF